MSINVYWSCIEDEWMLAEKPESVASRFYKNFPVDIKNPALSIQGCPFFNKRLKNVYAIKSIYNYSFYIENNNVYSKDHTQEFFDEHVFIRSVEDKFFSFNQRIIFYTDEKSLNVSVHEFPVYEENNITDRCKIIGGEINIGKYFRNVEFPFVLRKNYNEFKVEKGEVLYYIRFHTEEKINFIQFRFNDVLLKYLKDYRAVKNLGYIKTIENFYSLPKNKKLIIKEIEKNFIE
jgi:hypothetical protein